MRGAAIAVATILIAGAAAPGTTAMKRALRPPPLLPLNDKDKYSTGETGCETSISQGKDTLIFVIGASLILRTGPGAAGLQVCRPPDVANFDGGGKSVTCGDRRFLMHHVGKTTGNPEADSAGGNGVLMMSDRTDSRRIKVSWGTAC